MGMNLPPVDKEGQVEVIIGLGFWRRKKGVV